MNERISVQDKCLLVCLLQPSFLWNIHHLPLCLPRPKSKQILSYKHWGRTLRATVTSFPDKEKIASAGAQLFLLLLCASLVLHRLHSQAFPCPSVVLCGFPHIYLLADIYIYLYIDLLGAGRPLQAGMPSQSQVGQKVGGEGCARGSKARRDL